MEAGLRDPIILAAAADDDAERLIGAAVACRRIWRQRWERFWLLRYENTLRRPTWRIEEETRAWHASRASVRRYAELRAELAAVRAERRDAAAEDDILVCG